MAFLYNNRIPLDRDWASKPKGAAHTYLLGVARELEQSQRQRDQDYWRFARMYGGLVGNDLLLGLKNFISPSTNSVAKVPRFSVNVAKSVVDTSVAKITATDVKTTWVTDGGSWKQRRKAKALETFGKGLAHHMKLRARAPVTFRDGCIFGTAPTKVYEIGQTGRIAVERVLPHEILWDDQDGMYGEPQELFQRKVVARRVLLKLYPKAAVAISKAPRADQQTGKSVVLDAVTVWEAWHLPSEEDAGDGRHVICVEGGTLLDEPWKRDHFPFAMFRYLPRVIGFGGFGLVESGYAIQVEINRVNRCIQENLHVMAVGRVFLPVGSKIVKGHLSTTPGAIIEYVGEVPTFSPGGGINPQVIEYRDDLKRTYYELAGVSQFAASNLKPMGINAAVAMRAYADNQQERFTPVSKNFEQWRVEVDTLAVELVREIYERDGEFRVTVPGSRYLNSVDWCDIDLAADEMVIQPFPANALPTTPEARIQAAQEYMQAGILDRAEGLRALDFPDTRSSIDLLTADIDSVEAVIGKMLDDGEYEPPDLYLPLQLAYDRTKQHYRLAKREGAPEERVELLRRYMTELDGLIKSQQPAPANAAPMGAGVPGPGGGAPQARPEAAPQSPLLPNAPPAAA
jgi:hypothetical protein